MGTILYLNHSGDFGPFPGDSLRWIHVSDPSLLGNVSRLAVKKPHRLSDSLDVYYCIGMQPVCSNRDTSECAPRADALPKSMKIIEAKSPVSGLKATYLAVSSRPTFGVCVRDGIRTSAEALGITKEHKLKGKLIKLD